MNSIDLLLQTRPLWVQIVDQTSAEAKVSAAPPPPGGRPARIFYLELWESKDGGVRVAEQDGKQQLPSFCPERHINPDHSFCLALNSQAQLFDRESAICWWSNLEAFLVNQAYAERHGVWPLSAGLSHGDAACIQLKMEAIAEPLGWKDDVLLAIFRGKGWLSGQLPRVSKTGDRIVNTRSPCPRGCTQKHKLMRRKSCELDTCDEACDRQHHPILRAACPNRYKIEALVLLEHQRRKVEAQFIQKLVQDGHQCCGTMKSCPMRKDA